MPGYIDPKFRDDEPMGDVREGPKATWLQTIGLILGGILACFLAGAAALFYLFTEILPSLNH